MAALLTYWHLDPMIFVFLILMVVFYLHLTDFKILRKSGYFFAGLILIVLSIASPLHFLGENYLMSAHMTSHVILLLIASPLLVAGLPEIRSKNISRFSEILVRMPWIPWMSGVCIMWFWHIPVIFNSLFESSEQPARDFSSLSISALQNIHIISLIVAGILFSWPIIGPVRTSRLFPLNAVLYLSTSCIFCSILGLLITFAPAGVYTPYNHMADRLGFMNMIRNQNGISALVDQQVAGLIMWVPGCLIYLTASMSLLMKWFREKNSKPVFNINNIVS